MRHRGDFGLALRFAAVGAAGGWLAAHVVRDEGLQSGSGPYVAAAVGAACAAAVGHGWAGRALSSLGARILFAATTVAASAVGGGALALLHAGSEGGAGRVAGASVLGACAGILFFLPTLAVVLRAERRIGRARPDSVVDGSDRRRAWFRAGSTVTVLAWLVGLAPWMERGWMLVAISGTLSLFAFCVADLVALASLFQSLRGAERSRDTDITPSDAPVLDLGLGDEQWVCTGARAHPYRSVTVVSHVLHGALFDVQGILTRAALTHTAVALLAAFALTLAPSRKAEPQPIANAPIPPPARIEPRGRELAWYPQHDPILVDLNGDGIEDVVGLRWDAAHEDAALSVVATDGATFETLWRTTSMQSQWSSAKTHLVRSADRLYLTDSEGLLHIYDLKTGREPRDRIPVAQATELCGGPGVVATAWLRDNNDYKTYDRGVFVDGGGFMTPGPRPAWCHVGDHRACDKPGDGPCVSSRRLKPVSAHVEASYLLEENEVGVALGIERSEGVRLSTYGSYIVGYDPKTSKVRWEHALAFDDGELHDDPRIHVAFGQGRVFGFYQQKGGKWVLGARDGLTGAVAWHREPPRSQHGTNFMSMTISPQRLYVVLDWRVEVFDPATGGSLGVIW